MMGGWVMIGVVIANISIARLPIYRKLFLEGPILEPIKIHVDGLQRFFLMVSLVKPAAVELSTLMGVGGCG